MAEAAPGQEKGRELRVTNRANLAGACRPMMVTQIKLGISGAKGVDLGRNVWQNENPLAMIQAIRAIVSNSP